MGDEDYATVLRREFAAKEGWFLLQLRCDFVWNRTAFTRLTTAMLDCCQVYDENNQGPTLLGPAYGRDHPPRWLVEGFWFLADFVEGHTSHPAWKQKIAVDPDYYAQAYQRLHDLVDGFFTGQSGYLDPVKHFAPM